MPVPFKKNSFLGVLVVSVGRVSRSPVLGTWCPIATFLCGRIYTKPQALRKPTRNRPSHGPQPGHFMILNPDTKTSLSIKTHQNPAKPIKTHQTTKPINISTDCIKKTQITSCHIYQHPSTWLVATHLRSDRLAATGPIGFNIQALPQLFRHMIHFP